MIKKFVTYIEQEPWDEELERQDKWIDKFCWGVIIAATIFFIPICVNSVLEVRDHEAKTISIAEKSVQYKMDTMSAVPAADQDYRVQPTAK